ncbi:MAG: hypothetical protein AABY15_07355 [Nanoarchaeota archaeon]
MANEPIVLGGNAERNQKPTPINQGASNPSNDSGVNTEKTTKDIAKEHNIPEQYLETEFQVPTETVELPSKGVFYPNNKSSVTIKYLTAEEDDILYSGDLIKSGKVLDVLLDKAVMDKDLRPEDMLSGDRNFLLIEMRKTGLGNEYVPGEIQCPSCGQVHEPTIDLDKLKAKSLEIAPDSMGEYDVQLPLIKANIKFRFLNGKDEKRLSKTNDTKGGKNTGGIKVSKLITEKYLMQIMEVNGNRDKLYIKKFIGIMPMKDSAFFREYVRRIEPGLDLSYDFECPSCGHIDNRDIPVTPKLFYPDLEK